MYIGPTQSAEDLNKILSLQQRNLPKNIKASEAKAQGFVTVEHNFDLLSKMNTACPHTIARDGETLAGYALVMLSEFRNDIPVLVALFESIDQLEWNEKPMNEIPYTVMGQVCIDKKYRGQGIFERMYRAQQQRLGTDFDLIVTEISSRNTRSLRAHEKVGFKTVKTFQSDGETWVVVALETLK